MLLGDYMIWNWGKRGMVMVIFVQLKEATSITAATTITAGNIDTGISVADGVPLPAAVEEDDDRPPGPGLAKKKKNATSKQVRKQQKKRLNAAEIVVRHVDIIEDKFWEEHPYLLGEEGGAVDRHMYIPDV